jgi:DNA-binding MarR family transcriptional regulator
MGVTYQQHHLLLAVKGRSGRSWASVLELAEALQVRHPAVVGLLNRCVTAGLVQRQRDQEDGRQVRVVLTTRGEQILRRLSLRNRDELRRLRQALERL